MTPKITRLPRWAAGYKTVAVVFLNIIVFFVILNLLAYAGLAGRDYLKAHGGGAIPKNPWAERAKVYPNLSQEEIFELFMETWERRGFEYQPLSQFRESPFRGRFVNVTEAGYRQGRGERPWPPAPDAFSVFVFGGSTTFGYGLPDRETVPSFIEEILVARSGAAVAVYNFGRAAFFSTHELLEFQRLLMAGHKPDAAIFIDGLNEFLHADDELLWTERIRAWQDRRQLSVANSLWHLVESLPAYELTAFLIRYLGTSEADIQEQARRNVAKIIEGGAAEKAEKALRRFLRDKALISALAERYGVTPYFVWQPVPTYKYKLDSHLFAYREMTDHLETGKAYVQAFARHRAGDFGEGFVWCADIQEGIDRPLYVDAIHYNAELARMVAECVVEGSDILSRIAAVAAGRRR